MALTKKDILDIIVMAANQHGGEDVDDLNREVHDLRMALESAIRIMDTEQAERLALVLKRRGMLAGWF